MADEGEDEPMEELPKLEEGPLKERLMKIFKMYTGDAEMIPISELSKTSTQIGKMETNILKTLGEMDFNGDGYVEESEWELYFATMASSMTATELDTNLEDIEASAQHVNTIRLVMLTQADSKAAAADDETQAECNEEMAALMEALSDEKKALVKELFAAWDFNGNGVIDLGPLTTTTLAVGPRQQKIFGDFGKMDANGDGEVSLSEMMTFFSITSSMMTDEAFKDIIAEMLDMALGENGVLHMLELAKGLKQATLGDDEEDGEEFVMPDMSAERTEKVKALFAIYSPDNSDIDLADLAAYKAGSMDIGPAKQNMLAGLTVMDANGDGKVELQEMILYFAVVGEKLTDDSFNSVMDDMVNLANTAKMLKAASN